MPYTLGDWLWSEEQHSPCQVIEVQNLWGETFYRVWLPQLELVVRLPAHKVRSLDTTRPGPTAAAHVAYLAAAARVADTLTHQETLLAPIEAGVIPLPHQVRALRKAVGSEQVRYLLADEVGLGKTIEAGLILRELKLRGLVKRCLVVAPKGLVTQWLAEMRTHFGEEFKLLQLVDLAARGMSRNENYWCSADQVVCSLDAVKPLERRRGWSKDQLAEYNRMRFEDLVGAGWDLVIVDEAHRLGGSTDQVARYRLGQGLAECSPYLLLLSATPHQGKTDAFHRLIALLDQESFPDPASLEKTRVQPFVIRTGKRQAIDAQGQPLFYPRQTSLLPVLWEGRHSQQRQLYEAVTYYVREGYNRARREKKNAVGFLMVLLQRLVTSSTQAIRATLERRLDALQLPSSPTENESELESTTESLESDEWLDLDGEELIEKVLNSRLDALVSERAEVETLLRAAQNCEDQGPDAKAEALLDWLYGLQQEETNPDLKFLVFTEFVATQEMLQNFLSGRGFKVACLNGAMSLEERSQVQLEFARTAQVLISTDAGGEGLNLQFCHLVVNYDLPWNPMRLEQRIGRVDRIGQTSPVKALNLVLADTVEFRVREVLEEKLARILKEFGVDKTGDVLDSAQAGRMFDELYVETLLNPDSLETRLDSIVQEVQSLAQNAQQASDLLGSAEELDPEEARQALEHPLPGWVERMTINYLEAHSDQGGRASRKGSYWSLNWPDGFRQEVAVFQQALLQFAPGATHLTLEEPRIRNLADRLPVLVEGQALPWLDMAGLPAGITGYWSLWQVSLQAEDWSRQQFLPLFWHSDGNIYQPTARYIWDQLLNTTLQIKGFVEGSAATAIYQQLRTLTEAETLYVYKELAQAHRTRLSQARERGEYSFAARQRAVERIGLDTVRSYRLKQLGQEKLQWQTRLSQSEKTLPELAPLLILKIGAA